MKYHLVFVVTVLLLIAGCFATSLWIRSVSLKAMERGEPLSPLMQYLVEGAGFFFSYWPFITPVLLAVALIAATTLVKSEKQA